MYIPIKKLGNKRSLTWITQEIWWLYIRKRDNFIKNKSQEREKIDITSIRSKDLVQSKIKTAYNNYLADIQDSGWALRGGGGENTGFTSKKLSSLIKNSRQDIQGISSLKDSSDNVLYSENTKKANLLKKQLGLAQVKCNK